MINVMEFNNIPAVIVYDPDISMFRGEFVWLNGGADFYAEDVAGLRREGQKSLDIFLEMCNEKNIKPFKENRKPIDHYVAETYLAVA